MPSVQKLMDPTSDYSNVVASQEQVEEVLGKYGVDEGDTVVFYDDINSLWATRALWTLKFYGHEDVRVMDGGLKKWKQEGRELSTGTPEAKEAEYTASSLGDTSIRVSWSTIASHLGDPGAMVLDTRSPQEFNGEVVHPAVKKAGARAGHIPGSAHLNWVDTVNSDGTFKSVEKLKAMYSDIGVTKDKSIYTLCYTGIRAAHEWFLLKYALGYPDVKVYDGSWVEWANYLFLPAKEENMEDDVDKVATSSQRIESKAEGAVDKAESNAQSIDQLKSQLGQAESRVQSLQSALTKSEETVSSLRTQLMGAYILALVALVLGGISYWKK